MCVCEFEFYVPPTAKVIPRRDIGLKTHPKVWRNPESNSRPLVYEASRVGRCSQQNGVTRVLKVKVSDFGLRSLRFQNSNLFFSETSRLFETKFHMKAHGRKKMKIYSNKFGHMSKMVTMTIYGKNPSKIFFPQKNLDFFFLNYCCCADVQ